jgi:hypothetical protein
MSNSLRISDLLMERYNLGEVTAQEKQLVEDELKGSNCDALGKKLADLKKSDADIKKRFSKEIVFAKISIDANKTTGETGGAEYYTKYGINNNADKSKINTKFSPVFGSYFKYTKFAAFAAAVIILLALPLLASRAGIFKSSISNSGTEIAFAENPNATERAKGNLQQQLQDSELTLFLKSSNAAIELENNAKVKEGDTVQLAYSVQNKCYGVLFSIDGRGVVTLHYPSESNANNLNPESTELAAGKLTLLEEAYTLDDAPLYETFYFVTSLTPLNTNQVLSKAEIVAETKMFNETEVKSINLIKGEK